MAATVIQISKLRNVSAMMFRASVVRSNTAITLTIAEFRMREITIPVSGGSISGTACGRTTAR